MSNPIHIREIDHVVLRVRDMNRMRSFYCDILGCTVEKVQAHIGLVQLRAGSSLIDLIDKSPGDGPARNMDHFCVRVEPFDADAIIGWLRTHSVSVGEVASRYGAEGEGPSIYVEDPEGNTVELKGPVMRMK